MELLDSPETCTGHSAQYKQNQGNQMLFLVTNMMNVH